MKSGSFKNLLIWQKSMELAKEIYSLTKSFPKEEIYSLTQQIRRSALSIPCNIAEGKGRETNAEFLRFLQYALGSLYELQTQLELAKYLEYIDDNNEILNKCFELEKMINSLITKKKQKREGNKKSSSFNLSPST